MAHDPTQLNRQGPDVGTQYRSAIFPDNAEQANVAKAYIAQLTQARTFGARSSRVSRPADPFYRAEDVPPGLPHAQPTLSVHRHPRSAEDRGSEAVVPQTPIAPSPHSSAESDNTSADPAAVTAAGPRIGAPRAHSGLRTRDPGLTDFQPGYNVIPPSTRSTCPWMNFAAGEQRNATALAWSRGVP